MESGVLAFRREHNGQPLILLISKKRSKKVGHSKRAGAPASELRRERRERGIRGGGRDRSRLIDLGRGVSRQKVGDRLVG